jgi:ketosteroid isomerase-like protein/catechol 2,3-dioxygenase-like lactoylglutathione lyase family enzyme
MTTAADNKQRLQHVFAELERGNSRPFVDSFADDVKWTIAGTTKWSRTYDGKQAVFEQLLGPLRARLAAAVKISSRRFIADDDLVVVEASGEATTITGRPYNNSYCWIFRLAGGKVAEITEYLDTELVAHALDAPGDANVTQAVPFFMVTSIDASLRFYVDGLGFRMTNSWTPHARIEWCSLQRGEVALMLQEYREGRRPAGTLGAGVSICVICEDAIAFYKEVKARGIGAKRPFVGNRMWVTSVTDPDGYHLDFESLTDAPEETEYAEESV